MNFSFLYPYALFLLIFLPCFIWCRQKAQKLYFPKEEWLPKQTFLLDNQLFYLMLIYTLLVLALASPFSYSSEANFAKKGRDLVLVLDTSGSMGERGFNVQERTQSKYDISVVLAKDFIDHRMECIMQEELLLMKLLGWLKIKG